MNMRPDLFAGIIAEVPFVDVINTLFDAGLPLTVTEFWIIHSLIRHPGHVRTRQQLMDDANVLVDDQTITSHVKRIRRKFLQADPDFDRLDTVYGAGYRWKPERESG